MTALLIVLVIALAGVLIFLATREAEYDVRRSLFMQVESQRVFDKVRDLSTWQEWSPWLMHEPETRLSYSNPADQEGAWYRWDGQRVGAGQITHERFEAPQRIEQKIEFTRPFKSVSKVSWEFVPQANGTEVTWRIQGRMPFLLRFMTATTQRMIARDYDLGLALLRGLLDPSAERPRIEFVGRVQLPVKSALAIPFTGDIDLMIRAMQSGFTSLAAHVEQSGGGIAGSPFTAYHQVNLKTMRFRCDLALPVSDATPRGEFEKKQFPGGAYFKVTLQGSYGFLESTWHSAISHIRMLQQKRDRTRPSYEVYENDPAAVVHSNEILTSLYIPIR